MTNNAHYSADELTKYGLSTSIRKPIRYNVLHNRLSEVVTHTLKHRETLEPVITMSNDSKRVSEKKILLVEDNKTNQVVALALLKKFGYKADVANDGSEGIKALAKTDYDLVFMDCQMPIIESVGPDGSVSFFDTLPDRNNTGDMRKKVLLTIATTTTSAILLRKSALFDIGLFDENLKFWQEYEMLIRMAQRSPFYYVNEALIVYRVDRKDKNRLTNKYYEWLSTARYIRRKHIKLYRHLTLGEYKLYRLMFHDDAIARAETCGLPQEVEKHHSQLK